MTTTPLKAEELELRDEVLKTVYASNQAAALLGSATPEAAEYVTNEIMHLIDRARIEELERLHRYDGKDYDTELDEIIDERIAALRVGEK
jgi:hypothetical protein